MLLILHILTALASLVFAGTVYFKSSQKLLYFSYSLVGVTIASGTGLIVANSHSLVSACLTGLGYLSIVLTILVVSKRKISQNSL